MNRSRNNPNQNKLIPLIAVLLFAAPQFIIPILIIWGIVTVAKKSAAQVSSSQPNFTSATPRTSAPRYSTRQEKFDDCPQSLFCFHKDKGEHHVRKGKEMDPWDRPDIDISKYQRKR